MQIQTNTDHNIDGHAALKVHVTNVVESALSQLSEHITRVEVHLSDENGMKKDQKGGNGDKRCVMEARLEGSHPLVVTAHADTLHQSIESAADKLTRLVESTVGRLRDHKHRRNAPTPDEHTPAEAE